MFRSILSRFAVVVAVCLSAGLLHAETLSVDEANKAVEEAVARKEIAGPVKVIKVLGCVPASGRKPGMWICPLEMEGWDGPFDAAFYFGKGQWKRLVEDMKPACPSFAEAETLLRAVRKSPALRVKGSPDDEGLFFTSERGVRHDKQGPYRVMCRYEVKENGRDWFFLTYVWFANGRFIIDDDVEIWPD